MLIISFHLIPISKFWAEMCGYGKLAQLLIFWFHGESLDLQILKISLEILANNLQNNDIDLKKLQFLGQLHEREIFTVKYIVNHNWQFIISIQSP